MEKWLKRITTSILAIIVILLVVVTIFYMNSYQALEAEYNAMSEVDMSGITFRMDSDEISYKVENPKKNIVFVPGGLVQPDAYSYLALSLAKEGYDVTISKALFNLAIFTPNRSSRFLSDELDNVVIGHSLGGVTSSLMASGNDDVDTVIFLGSYPIADLKDKEVYIILAEHDIAMDMDSFNDSLKYTLDETIFTIEGGNHAQFGWYGPQRGDGEAEIDTLTQHEIVVDKIIEYIE